jgi:CRISPR-associated protein Csm2
MKQFNKSILIDGIKEKDLAEIRDFGAYLTRSEKYEDNNGKKKEIKPMTYSQIRRFFGALKRIQFDFEKLKGEIILLEPKLAYAVGRDDNKTKIKYFYDAISPLLKEINEDKNKYENFVHLVEAIVAYHKVAGGE